MKKDGASDSVLLHVGSRPLHRGMPRAQYAFLVVQMPPILFDLSDISAEIAFYEINNYRK